MTGVQTCALPISTASSGQINFGSQVTVNQANQHYRVEPLQFSASVQGNTIPDGKQTLSLNTQLIEVDLKQQTLTLDGIAAKVMEASLSGDVQARHLQTQPLLTGTLQLANLNLQKLLKQLGVQALPSDELLKTVALKTQFEAGPANVKLTNLHLSIDDNQLQLPQLLVDFRQQTLKADAFSLQVFGMKLDGQVTVNQFNKPSIKGQLALAPFNPREVIKRLEQAQLLPPLSLPEPALLPLKTAALETQFQIRQATDVNLTGFSVHIDDNHLKMPQLQVDLKKQTLNANAVSLQLLGVKLDGQVTVNQFNKPSVKGQLTLAPFNLRELLKRLEQAQLLPPQSLPDEQLLPLKTAALETQFHIREATDMRFKGFNLRLDDNHLTMPQLQVDLTRETLDLPAFSLQALGINLDGNIQVEQLLSSLNAQAQLAIAPFNPKTVLERLGQPVPETTDPTALNSFALETQLQGGLSQLNLASLKIQLDNSQLQGNLQIQDFQRQAIAFHLGLDQIDLDRYLPPKPAEAEESQPTTPPASGDEVLLPFDLLRSLNINGTLTVGKLKVANLKLDDISVKIAAQNGQIKLNKAAKLYQGTYSGNLTLDAQPNERPHVHIEQNLRAVKASPLLIDLTGDDRISGTANLETQLTADVTTLNSLQQTLEGPIKFQFLNGQLKGVNLGHALRQAKALYQGEPLPEAKTRLTDFANLQGTLVAKNGILSNNDLQMESPLLRVTGNGHVVMSTQEIDFLLTPTVVSTSTGQGGKALEELYGIPIPLKITGKLNAPQVRPDKDALKGIAKAIAKAKLDEEKRRLQAKAEEEKQRLQAKLEEEKQRLQAKLEEEKQRRLEQAKAKVEEEKQRLLEQAKARAEEEKQKLLDSLKKFGW